MLVRWQIAEHDESASGCPFAAWQYWSFAVTHSSALATTVERAIEPAGIDPQPPLPLPELPELLPLLLLLEPPELLPPELPPPLLLPDPPPVAKAASCASDPLKRFTST